MSVSLRAHANAMVLFVLLHSVVSDVQRASNVARVLIGGTSRWLPCGEVRVLLLVLVRGRGTSSVIKLSQNTTKALIEQPAAYSADISYAHDHEASLGGSSP
jgi:hypothetical protein